MEHNETTHSNSHKGLMLIAAVVLLVGGLVGGYFIGKSASDDSASNSAATSSVSSLAAKASASEHNDADVMFAQMMVPHHTQATEMAKLAETRASSPEVKALAAKIAAAQQPEIDKMNTWLDDWGTGTSSDSSMAGMDHGSMNDSGSMTGMMSEDDMTSLAAMSGAEFDKTFLTMMIEHHTGAISMAEDEMKNGKNADALALATSIQVTQQAEVNEMKALLN